jgi:tetratricopeptide (TPR) repeat protein
MKLLVSWLLLLLLHSTAYCQVNPVAKKALDDGISRYNKKDYKKAIEFFTQAIKSDSFIVNAFIYRALAKDALENFPAAIADFNRARKLDTNDVYIYFERAQTFLNLGEMEAALKDFEKVVEINPNSSDAAESFFFMGRICHKEKKWERAVNYFTRVIRFRPKDTEVFFYRGESKYFLGDEEGAIKDLSQAIEFDSDNEQAFFRRAEAKLKLGDELGACQDFKKAKSKGESRAVEMLKTHCSK